MLSVPRAERNSVGIDHRARGRDRPRARRRRLPARTLLPRTSRSASEPLRPVSRAPGTGAPRRRDHRVDRDRHRRRLARADSRARLDRGCRAAVDAGDLVPCRHGLRDPERHVGRRGPDPVPGRPGRAVGGLALSMIPEKRFWLLRRLAKVLTVGAWLVFGLVVLVTPVGVARGLIAQNQAEVWDWIKYGLSGGLIFINLLWIAQSIQVILAIEENTKQSTYVLEKLTTLAQQIRDRLAESADRSEARGDER